MYVACRISDDPSEFVSKANSDLTNTVPSFKIEKELLFAALPQYYEMINECCF